MICKKCKEMIATGEACHVVPAQQGSTYHAFYHLGCYIQIRQEQQERQEAQVVEQLRLDGIL